MDNLNNSHKLSSTDKYLELGNLHLHDKNYALALEEFSRVLKVNPRNKTALIKLGHVYLQQKKLLEAITQFKKALELDPESPEPHEGLGLCYLEQGHIEEALLELTHVLKSSPDNENVRFGLGLCYNQKKEFKKAVEEFSRVLKINPDHLQVKDMLGPCRIRLGHAFFKEKSYAEAITQFKKALELDPESPGPHEGLGLCYFEQGHTEESLMELSHVLRLDPDNEGGHFGLGLCYNQKKEFKKAVEEFSRVLKINPDHLQAKDMLGRCRIQLGLWLTQLGHAFFKEKSYAEAITQFKKALELDPESPEPHEGLGLCYLEQGHIEEALLELTHVLKSSPDNENVRFGLGLCYNQKKEFKKAVEEFSRVLKINPDHLQAKDMLGPCRTQLGHAYLKEKNYTCAIAQFKKAVEEFNKGIGINTGAELAHQGLGNIYIERQLYKLAEREFEETLRFNDSNIYAHQMLGYVYKRNGRHDLAVGEFIKATNLYLSSEALSGKLSNFENKNNVNLTDNKNIAVKILRMPSFCNKGVLRSTELNTSLLPPLALGQIAAYLRENSIEIDQDDLNIKIHYDNYYSETKEKEVDTSIFFDEDRISRYISGAADRDLDSIMENVERKSHFLGFDVILISLPIIFDNSSGFLFTLALCRFLKDKYNPLIVAGGGNQSIELLGKYGAKDIDFIIYGDGEDIILKFLLALKNNIDPKGVIPSQAKDGRIIADKIYPPLKPDFSGLPIDMYRYAGLNSSPDGSPVAILEEFNRSKTLLLPFKFIRGCPYECVFCPESTNKSIYVLEPMRVALYLKELQEEYEPTGFFFLSDTINISRQYINELCDEIINNKGRILWTDSARADFLDKDTILKMRRAGCIRLIFGMETASLRLLRYIDKRIALKNLENILKWTDEAGIWTGLEVICGLPHEKDGDIKETIAFLERNKDHINSLYFNQFGLRDGSILLQEAGKFGINNVIEINQYADEEFTYYHKYGYDESGGLAWQDKKKQILASHRKLLSKISWNVDFPVYEFEHFLFFLYNKFNKKNEICDAYNKVAGGKVNLLKKLSDSVKLKD